MMLRRFRHDTNRYHPRIEVLEDRRLMAIDPSPLEQEYMQLTNRFRNDPTGEFSRLMISASPAKARDQKVDDAVQFFGVNGTVLQQELQSLTSQPPLAWSDAIYSAAAAHNARILQANTQSHQFPGEPALRDRLRESGFVGGFLGENVYGYGQSVIHTFAAHVIDWGVGPNGMQHERGHRVNLIRPIFNRTAIAFLPGPGTGDGKDVGPLISTQDLGELLNARPMVVGAVFQDRNNSQAYEAGEGIGFVQLTFEGAAGTFSTTSMTAGGYQLELPAGTYRAIASGGGLRAPVVIPNVQVANSNVWLNVVYDPNATPLDRFETNNSPSEATLVASVDQTIASVNIHAANDLDYFRLVPNSTGTMRVDLQHSSAVGNLDLRLINSAGTVIASSVTLDDTETILLNVLRGETYYALVQASGNATNPAYQLRIDFPEPMPPTATRDFATIQTGTNFVDIPVLDNDHDPDGAKSGAVISLQSGGIGGFTIENGKLRYSPPPGYSGVDRATYKVIDDQGLSSSVVGVQVFVIDFARARPFQNSRNAVDINDDGFVSAIDALLIITEINSRNPRLLPTNFAAAGDIFGFLDGSGDGFLTALDALLTINVINTRATTAATGEMTAPAVDPESIRGIEEVGGSTPMEESQIFSAYLEDFANCEPLRTHLLKVLNRLPPNVVQDFVEDPTFRVTLENYQPGKGWSLWMPVPEKAGGVSRCVVLRRRLADRSEEFACYVIAHEFAHAFLRNGGWGDIDDAEDAADALAASWGFARTAAT